MIKSRLTAGTLLLFGAFGCAPTDSSDQHSEGAISVLEFERTSKKYEGRIVSIAGYLVTDSPGLLLYVNKSRPPIQEAPVVVVEDLEMRRAAAQLNYGEASILAEAGCVDHYAVVLGEIGKTGFGSRGIIRLVNVRVYDDSEFTGAGVVCYPK